MNATKYNHGLHATAALIKFLFYIGRSWTCDRNSRDNSPHRCFAEKYDSEGFHRRREIDERGELDDLAKGQLAPSLHRIWPKSKVGDWKNQ